MRSTNPGMPAERRRDRAPPRRAPARRPRRACPRASALARRARPPAATPSQSRRRWRRATSPISAADDDRVAPAARRDLAPRAARSATFGFSTCVAWSRSWLVASRSLCVVGRGGAASERACRSSDTASRSEAPALIALILLSGRSSIWARKFVDLLIRERRERVDDLRASPFAAQAASRALLRLHGDRHERRLAVLHDAAGDGLRRDAAAEVRPASPCTAPRP